MTIETNPSDDQQQVSLDTVPARPPLLDQMRELQGKADAIGPVDPDFNYKDYSNTL